MPKCSLPFSWECSSFLNMFLKPTHFLGRGPTLTKQSWHPLFPGDYQFRLVRRCLQLFKNCWFLGIALVVFRMGTSNLYLTLSFRSRYISSWFSFCLTLSVKINFFCLPLGHCPSPQEDGRKYKHWKDCFENLIKVVFGDPGFDNQIIKHSLLWLIYCYDFFAWTS